MTRAVFATSCITGLVLAALGGAPSVTAGPTADDVHQCGAAVVHDFKQRVAAYAALREQLEQPLPPLRPTLDMGSVYARRTTLAVAIKAARPHAGRGDIFTVDTARYVQRIIRDTLENVDVEAMLDDLNEGDRRADGVHLRVHDDYPEWATHAMPALLLMRLPELPDDIQYRLMGYDLVLLDLRTGLVLDILSAAIPSPSPAGSRLLSAGRDRSTVRTQSISNGVAIERRRI